MQVETLAEGVTLYNADCRDVMPTLGHIDAVISSPPYNCGMDYGPASDNLSLDSYKQLLKDSIFAGSAVRRCINTGVYIGSRKTRVLARGVVLGCTEETLVDEIIWDKGPARGTAWGNYPTSPRIRAQHEVVYIFGDKPIASDTGISWQDWSVYTASIWRIHPNVDLTIHPAQMPIELANRLAKLYSPAGGLVCDPFTGSGTTGVAAVSNGRKFVGVEIDQRYFDIACKRISEALKQPDFFQPAPTKAKAKQEKFL